MSIVEVNQAKPFLFEHLFKQSLWRVQQQRLSEMVVNCVLLPQSSADHFAGGNGLLT